MQCMLLQLKLLGLWLPLLAISGFDVSLFLVTHTHTYNTHRTSHTHRTQQQATLFTNSFLFCFEMSFVVQQQVKISAESLLRPCTCSPAAKLSLQKLKITHVVLNLVS